MYNPYKLFIRRILEAELLIGFKFDLELSNAGLRGCEGQEGSGGKTPPPRGVQSALMLKLYRGPSHATRSIVASY